MSLSVFRMMCLTLLVLWAGHLRAADAAQPTASVAASSPASHPAGPAAASGVAAASSAASAVMPVRRWVQAPRVHGRLTAKDLGLVINEDDPYSVQIGAYYAKARQIPASRILKVRL
ncbi:MAG: hypothetical protein KA203_04440, partial [Aquabacterium sp.]|nr:hypothetical protein [Aquabacterium sp.]